MKRYAWTILLAAALFVGCQQASNGQEGTTVESTNAAPDAPAMEVFDVDAPVDLLAGSVWEYRMNDGDWQEGPLMLPAGFEGEISMRIRFDLTQETIDELACTQLEQLTNERLWQMDVNYFLNGTQLLPSIFERGIFYSTIRGIDPGLLVEGENTLSFSIKGSTPEAKPFWTINMELLAMLPKHLELRTGPIVSAFDEDGVWITCRTNIPAEVTLDGEWVDTDTAVKVVGESSDDGLNHKFYVPRNGDKLDYKLTAPWGDDVRVLLYAPYRPGSLSGSTTGNAFSRELFVVNLWSEGKPLKFVFTGDTQKNPDSWGAIADAVAAEEVTLVASVGDMNEDGLFDWRWDPELFTPGAALFATTPFYPGVGNHEVNYNSHFGNRDSHCVILDDFFVMPENHVRHSWSQQVGPVLIVSLEGHRDFSPGTDLHAWLVETLEGAGDDVDYIFLLQHYPAWSSGGYMHTAEDGSEPRWYVDAKQAREVIVPLLKEHDATALVVGHDHFYQRSETPDGFTQILTGTAGSASTPGAQVPAGNNPHAVIGRGGPHYCLFEVTDEGCVMTVKTADGEVIDTKTFQPRETDAE
jgi:hypothetical protein